MSDMTVEKATALRRPFPPESIGQLPKGGVMLDFVGHAAVTDRLLSVDPDWAWDFAETDPATGKPSLRYSSDPEGNLWIRLTICGVSRIGVGDGKNAKERIGDALRNAAMRFGVALDLWAKENLVEFAHAANAGRADLTFPTETFTAAAEPAPPTDRTQGGASAKQIKMLGVLMGKAGVKERGVAMAYVAAVIGHEVASRNDLSAREASDVINALQKDLEGAPA